MDRIVEMLYGKLGEKGVTQLTADRQEEKLGDIEDGYYEGYRSGYKEGSTDLLTGVGGRRTTVHDLYRLLNHSQAGRLFLENHS